MLPVQGVGPLRGLVSGGGTPESSGGTSRGNKDNQWMHLEGRVIRLMTGHRRRNSIKAPIPSGEEPLNPEVQEGGSGRLERWYRMSTERKIRGARGL